jgi:cytochrome c oxidase subunit 2
MQSATANPADFWHLPLNASLHGHALDRQLVLNLWIALGLIALAHLVLLLGLPLAALVLLFSFLASASAHLWATQRYTGANPAAMQVEVTGMQFVWTFRYPGPDAAFGQTRLSLVDPGAGNPLGLDPTDRYGHDDIVTSQLVLPAGREVDLTLRSYDVIHGFAIPQMRLKQNAVPGQTAHIHFTPELPGDYAILCTQLCGLGHYRMNAILRILPPAAFATWLKAHEATAGAAQ